jgi:Heat induced stress protein YflT
MSSEPYIRRYGNEREESAVVTGLFRSEAQAERAMHELKAAGFSGSQIGVACSDSDQEKTIAWEADGLTTSTAVEMSSTRHRSLLERLNDFFTGSDSDYTARDDLHGSLVRISERRQSARTKPTRIYVSVCDLLSFRISTTWGIPLYTCLSGIIPRIPIGGINHEFRST